MSNPEIPHVTHENLARVKLFVFMPLFHALCFPNQIDLLVPDAHDEDTQHLTVSLAMVDASITPRDKSLIIKREFMPLAKFLNKDKNDKPFYQRLVDFAKQNAHIFDDLEDDQGRALTAQEILPPETVIAAMSKDWIDNNKQFCPTLEGYVSTMAPNNPELARSQAVELAKNYASEESLRALGVVVMSDFRH